MSNYSENNNLILGLAYFDKEAKDVVSFSDVTVNAGRLPYLHGALNSFIVEESLVDFLVDNGFGQLTGEHLHTGFSIYPIFCFNEDKLQQISAFDYAEYAKANGQRALSQSAPLIKKIHDAEGKAGHRSGPEKFLPPESER